MTTRVRVTLFIFILYYFVIKIFIGQEKSSGRNNNRSRKIKEIFIRIFFYFFANLSSVYNVNVDYVDS